MSKLTLETTAWDNIPDELKSLRQWVCYRVEDRGGKPTKIPYQIDSAGRSNAKSNDRNTWHSFEEVIDSLSKPINRFNGVGFMLSESDPYVFIDLDHVVVDDGQIQPWAQELINRANSYTEFSQSGTGIHIIARAKKPGSRCRIHTHSQFEIYDDVRLVVFTGALLPGAPAQINDAQPAIDQIYSDVFGHEPQNVPQKESAKNKRPSRMPDRVLVERALSASNGDKFSRLWNGNIGEYDGDASAADMALCCMLAYWTGKDPVWMDGLFRASGLMREKWDELRGSQTYGQITIDSAVNLTKEAYVDQTADRGAKPAMRGGARNKGNPAHGPDGEPMNDLGNARRLIKKHGTHIRYCHDAMCWYCWDGRRWAKDDTKEIIRKGITVVDDMVRQADGMRKSAISNSDDAALEAAKSFQRHAVSSGNHSRIVSMIAQAECDPAVSILTNRLDTSPWLLNCSNGTLDLQTGELRPHSQLNLISKLINVAYNPEAQCPIWEKFIADIFDHDAELIRFIHQACGYTLTGNTREQVFFILHGYGSNGKSTFLGTLRDVLCDYQAKTTTDTFVEKHNSNNSNDVAALRGARMVSAIEVAAGKKMSESLVKELTGQDEVTARFLYKEFFTFAPIFKLWLACNHIPEIRGQDDGIWRRVRNIPFKIQFQDEDHPTGPYKNRDLPDQLRTELEGILAWLVRGCADWNKYGLSMPAVVMKSTANLRKDMDPLDGFFSECCVTGKNVRSQAKDLYSAYVAWAEENGDRPLSQRWFGLRLSERSGFSNFRGAKGVRCWKGIGLLDSDNSSADPSDVTDVAHGTLFAETFLRAKKEDHDHGNSNNAIESYSSPVPQVPQTSPVSGAVSHADDSLDQPSLPPTIPCDKCNANEWQSDPGDASRWLCIKCGAAVRVL